jgi:hypothetical protein
MIRIEGLENELLRDVQVWTERRQVGSASMWQQLCLRCCRIVHQMQLQRITSQSVLPLANQVKILAASRQDKCTLRRHNLRRHHQIPMSELRSSVPKRPRRRVRPWGRSGTSPIGWAVPRAARRRQLAHPSPTAPASYLLSACCIREHKHIARKQSARCSAQHCCIGRRITD